MTSSLATTASSPWSFSFQYWSSGGPKIAFPETTPILQPKQTYSDCFTLLTNESDIWQISGDYTICAKVMIFSTCFSENFNSNPQKIYLSDCLKSSWKQSNLPFSISISSNKKKNLPDLGETIIVVFKIQTLGLIKIKRLLTQLLRSPLAKTETCSFETFCKIYNCLRRSISISGRRRSSSSSGHDEF